MKFVLRTLIVALLGVGSPAAQAIQITSAPAYGSRGVLTGKVSGVNFATHRVAVYIHIEGSGWWTKPSSSAPTVSIQPDGTFSANVYTCCLDDRATLFHAALLRSGVSAPLAAGSCAVPLTTQALAVAHLERYGRTIQFAGRSWAVKDSPTPVGPGGNLFSGDPGDVFVDSRGRLHLRVVQRGGAWWSTEVILLDEVGYGTYWFTTETEVGSLDPNLTFGAFTWDSYCDDVTIPAWPNREIDFEDSRWGNPSDPMSSQVVVQPWTVPGNIVRYRTPPLGTPPTLSRFFTWTPSRIEFGAFSGTRAPCAANVGVIHKSTYLHNPGVGRRVPPAGREKFRFNLWINTAGAPRNGVPTEVIISDFRFAPAGVLPAGCAINPAGSASILSGSPKLGGTVTVGVDNPLSTQRAGSLAALIVAAQPSVYFPCGALLGGVGMTGFFGELLLDLGAPHVAVAGGSWAGAGTPNAIPLAIPATPSLAGLALYAQGVLIDPGGVIPIGLADGFELCIQP